MRDVFITFISILFALALNGQSDLPVLSKITDVTVYREGARITRKASVELHEGKNTLVFSSLTEKLDPESIQLKTSDQLIIVSVSHSYDFINQKQVSSKIIDLQSQQQLVNDTIMELKSLIQVFKEEKEMILSNKIIGGKDGLNIEELEKAAKFFRFRLSEIEISQKKIQKQIRQLNRKQIQLSKQLVELNSETQRPTSVIKAVVSSKQWMPYDLELKYLVYNAGWEPCYDIRIETIEDPLKLIYKAKVKQDSGEEWEDVHFVLSTANPEISNYKPELSPYFLTFNNYYEREQKLKKNAYAQYGFVKGMVTDVSTGNPLIGATILTLDGQHGCVTDLNGWYQMSLPKDQEILMFSYTGYESREQRIANPIINVALSPGPVLNDIAVVGYERSKMSLGYAAGTVNGLKFKKKVHIPIAIQKGQTSTEFVIDIPYTIPPDNHAYDVSMLEYSIDVDYQYQSIPKLSENAFLTAQITDWGKYHLLNGKSFLFLNGIYQGESFLDLKSLEDTLNISVGIDNDIIIERELLTDLSSRNFFKNRVKESKAWKISIKNMKDKKIYLTMEDQIPVSRNKEINVNWLEISGGTVNEDTGKISWNLELRANELKEIVIRYEVKYPQNRQLIIE